MIASAEQLAQLIHTPKEVAGRPEWRPAVPRKPGQIQPSRAYNLVVSLALNGQVIPDLVVRGRALGAFSPQDVNLRLQLGKAVLERVTLNPDGPHINHPPKGNGERLDPWMARHYPFVADRDYPPSKGGPWFAEVIPGDLESAQALIRYCCDHWAITGDIPPPPYNPVLL